MLHALLILLALLGIWKLLSHGRTDGGASLLTGLRRLALVLAITGAALGGLIGYVSTRHCTYAADWAATCTGPDPSGIALGAMVGFGVIWGAASVVIWIVSGFLSR